MGDQDTSWAPHFCCVTCARLLAMWAKGSRRVPFAIPMVWREPTDHVSDSYFCLTSVTGVTAKSKHTVQYSNLPSAMRPVPHSAELPVPKPPTNMTLSYSESSDEDVRQANNNMNCDPNFCRSLFFQWTTPAGWRGSEWYRPQFEPVKEASWTFRLQVKGLESSASGHEGVIFAMGNMKNSKVSSPLKMVPCFAMMFVALWKFWAMNITQISGACSLVHSKVSLRVVLLHNGNRFPSVPLAHAPTWRKVMKVWSYCWERLRSKYDEFKWKLCGDLEVMALLLGMQCNSGTQNTAVSCASGTAGTRRITM